MAVPKIPARNVIVRGHRTSLRLEPEVFRALDEICVRERLTLPVLCNRLLDRHGDDVNLSSQLRVHALTYFQALAGLLYPPPVERDQPRAPRRPRRQSPAAASRHDQSSGWSALS